MCNFKNTIKFCRCETKVASDKPTWTLKRYADADWLTMEQGRCHIPHYDNKTKNIAKNIVTSLNVLQANCFDMDYQTVAGDVLNIEMPHNNAVYEFEFENGQWQQHGSISTHLNRDLIIASGWVDNE